MGLLYKLRNGALSMSFYVEKHSGIITLETRKIISMRYKTVTKAINKEFWNISSDTQNSIYVGSYGRRTAINTSDLDILVLLPEREYERFDSLKGNGQSRLLQAVKNAIINSYPRSDIRADGQVVKISFSDGMKFEILPAFQNIDWWGNWDRTYKYPDSNMGGNWCSTNPKAEQEAMKQKNDSSNGLLVDTCRDLRYVRDNYFSSYHLSGIVIDSFVYAAMGSWKWTSPESTSSASKGNYESVLLDYLRRNSQWGIMMLNAPGSNQGVSTQDSLECLEKVMKFIVQ